MLEPRDDFRHALEDRPHARESLFYNLLLPGGCFLIVGIGFASEQQRQFADLGALMLVVAAAILGVAGLLFWVAFRRRSGSGTPPTAPLP